MIHTAKNASKGLGGNKWGDRRTYAWRIHGDSSKSSNIQTDSSWPTNLSTDIYRCLACWLTDALWLYLSKYSPVKPERSYGKSWNIFDIIVHYLTATNCHQKRCPVSSQITTPVAELHWHHESSQSATPARRILALLRFGSLPQRPSGGTRTVDCWPLGQ